MPSPHDLSYVVDGQSFTTADATLSGRQVRTQAGRVPASNYVLIMVDDLSTRSIGLEEDITLNQGKEKVFLTFEGDRAFAFLINERGYEWGAPQISTADIRLYGRIPDEHELFLDSARDRTLDETDVVRLARQGVERIRSRQRQQICIFVNTREKLVKPGLISFEDLIALAFPNTPAGPNTEYTVSYRKGLGPNPEGTLIAGETVVVNKGMIFNVSATDKS